MMGQPFEGHGIAGWDPKRKKYTMTWVDTMSVAPSSGESTWDAASRTLTGYMEGPDPTGAVHRMRMVTEYKDDATRVFTMYMNGPDGKEAPTMRITYKKRP
jgi:hypothetical protein